MLHAIDPADVPSPKARDAPHGADSDAAPPNLPLIDVHRTKIAAEAPAVWEAVLTAIDRTFSGAATRAFGTLVRNDPARTSGPRPLAEGATMPGFRVTKAQPEQVFEIKGSHVFSRYALRLHLEPLGPHTVLTATTLAEFPGLHGRAHRCAVIGSGGHARAVRRLLTAVRQLAERPRDVHPAT